MQFEFSFTEEQEKFRRSLRYFFENEIKPFVEELDRNEDFPLENIKKIAQQGYMGLNVPKEYGGMGKDKIEYGIFLEELGRVCAAHGTIVGAHLGLCIIPILLFGTEEQKKKYLPSLASGEKLGAFALTESGAGSDAANIQTTAIEDEDEYVLNGSKIFCTNGNTSDVTIIFAANDRSLGPMGGISAFIVEKDTPGFSVGKIETKMGIRASHTAELLFDNCRIPKENLLGTLGAGFMVALTTLDGGRVSLAAGSLGAAEKVLEMCVELLRNDSVEGGNLADRQSIQWKLADLAMEVHASKFMVYNTLSEIEKYYELISAGEKIPRQLRDRGSRGSAISKAYVTEVASRAITKAMEIQGVNSIKDGHEIERAFRDSFISEIYEGTNEIQRMLIARELLGLGN